MLYDKDSSHPLGVRNDRGIMDNDGYAGFGCDTCFDNTKVTERGNPFMIKKIFICAMLILFIFSNATFAFSKETINGIGVKAVQDVVDKIGRSFVKKNPNVAIKTKEDKVSSAIEFVAKGKPGSTFGMINRPLNDEEKSKYPDIQTFIFAQDGVALIVHPSNPVNAITSAQLKDILKGKITDWSQLGGNKGVVSMIIREKASNQRAAFDKLVMGKDKIGVGKAREISSMGDVKAEVAFDKAAMGYILISALDKKVKALEIDGVAPTINNLKAGAYPINIPFYLITNGKPQGSVKTFIDFIQSEEGQKLVEKEKIASVKH